MAYLVSLSGLCAPIRPVHLSTSVLGRSDGLSFGASLCPGRPSVLLARSNRRQSASRCAVFASAAVELEREAQTKIAMHENMAELLGSQPSMEQSVKVASMEEILAEHGACGVGVIASLKNEPSHKIVEQGLVALGCMEHRGGCSADNDSGDGAGVMTQIPWTLLASWQKSAGVAAIDPATAGVGQVFLPQEEGAAKAAKDVIEKIVAEEGLELIGWRTVPVNPAVVGEFAKATLPRVEQLVVKVPGEAPDDIERELYIVRKLVERAARSQPWGDELYFCSLSNRTIVYKGMLRSVVLGDFYLDLRNPEYLSRFAIYHRRFSTNTTPKWPLAQPMRFLGHNGEINTIQGNCNWMASRQPTLSSPVWRGREAELFPVQDTRNSDSANLDSVAELLLRSGRAPEETLMLLVPEAYQNHPTLTANFPEVTDFYEYNKGQMEPWDGPALLVFCNGKTVGACLDRNGLRPARFWKTEDTLYVASEVGVLSMEGEKVLAKGRLGPGMMISADLETGEVNENTDIKKRVAAAHPYKEWLAEHTRSLPTDLPFAAKPSLASDILLRQHNAFGYSAEDVTMVIEAMASQGKEPTFCMGDDAPLAVLSRKGHLLYDYLKQRFAQVTNPAIDPLREGLVMSLETTIGKRENLLEIGPDHANQVRLPSPVLSDEELHVLQGDPQLGAVSLPTFFDVTDGVGEGALERGLDQLRAAAEEAVKDGAQMLVLSDRVKELDASHPAIPALLAVGAVHHHLIQKGLRQKCSLVVDTAQCFSTHHFACLIGYGASAICPYLALETVRHWRASSKTEKLMMFGKLPAVSMEDAQQNFRKAVNAGLLKILSKMGISLLSSYCGAQVFEIYGLGADVVDTAFRGSVSRIGGLTLDELAQESASFWAKAFSGEVASKLENPGFIQFLKGGEYHGNNPEMSKLLHKSVREGSAMAYSAYQTHLANRPVNVLRDLLELRSSREPIPVEQVEPATAIVERFCTGGMSLGAISRETHEAIAIAMNRIGGKSNSGEGGEDPVRWRHLDDVSEDGKSPTFPHLKGLKMGDTATSAIKQVASGRFGVTPTFLANAEQVEIKVAQGAKPGEGGQLPGKKVSPYIATLRKSKAGVPLISPPPHHDIYSIEDLAQLIYDLHQVNPAAKVSVKLVAEAGIGTVASGVAKANADVIQISGHDGGTGASPISSIKHAGGPWEMGLTETHQTLLANGLRERVVLRVDGGFKSGVDVLLGAAMGADEFGFGSIAMIATGCIMARICHTNNCPVGVASQREELRARFPGMPGDLVNYFLFVAEEVRAGLAALGFEKLDDIIGHTDLLRPREGVALAKTKSIDMTYLIKEGGIPKTSSTARRKQEVKSNGPMLDDELWAKPEVADAIENEKEVTLTVPIINVDRSTGGRLAGRIAKKYGDSGFAGQLNLTFVGSAGQSFGCFLMPGMAVRLEGEANDYVGKGMAGGEIVIVPPTDAAFEAEDAIIIGNTCLYGATGGQLFARGKAGERFAVRNSLAEAVVEGTGDHCCEYMTGGCVVVLGKVGRNVGAGMTGGIAYFLDEDGTFESKVNKEIVAMQRVCTPAGDAQLKRLIQAYVDKTGSTRGASILASWDAFLPKFWQLVPPSEAQTPEAKPEVQVGEQELVAQSA
eukprot:TRINITY_DN1580_c2_g1_i1.p1 TRINITY_DN1580_c2_g1~~TRINITY_DN1580_c2_g1_i1.p1  ORF type:complete len:1628 (-),score=366.73 TRINITY_DN1580_c2_g1_i1:1822-6705(-)